MLHKLPEDNLENFYINSFGRELYSMFFEYYTENLWGRHPSEIDASWGAQRTKGLSIMGILKDVFGKTFHVKNREVNTSLIEEFKYPKLGPGQLWEVVAARVEAMGGVIEKNAKVTGLRREGSRIVSVTLEDGRSFPADAVVSSMPMRDLVGGMNDVPAEPARIAAGLPYRDYMTLGVLVRKLALVNRTDMTTVGGIVPDCWVYVQDRSVKMGRFQIYNNWSPYLVKDLENTVWVGLEYFCNEGDDFWNQSEEEFARLGVEEMLRIGLIRDASEVLDTHMEKVKKAYPAYFDTYAEIDTLIAWLDTIDNLYCVGRNGQHRYNNLDHSMMTSFEAVRCILDGCTDKSALWSVNTEKEYHEEKQGS
jgi:protoporphyrinogen oxidase